MGSLGGNIEVLGGCSIRFCLSFVDKRENRFFRKFIFSGVDILALFPFIEVDPSRIYHLMMAGGIQLRDVKLKVESFAFYASHLLVEVWVLLAD